MIVLIFMYTGWWNFFNFQRGRRHWTKNNPNESFLTLLSWLVCSKIRVLLLNSIGFFRTFNQYNFVIIGHVFYINLLSIVCDLKISTYRSFYFSVLHLSDDPQSVLLWKRRHIRFGKEKGKRIWRQSRTDWGSSTFLNLRISDVAVFRGLAKWG